MVIITAISFAYEAFASNRIVAMVLRGMQAGVGAVMLDVVASLGLNVVKEKSWVLMLIMIAAFIAAFVFNINASIIIVTVIVLVLAYELVTMARKRRNG
jgi:chromate transporter